MVIFIIEHLDMWKQIIFFCVHLTSVEMCDLSSICVCNLSARTIDCVGPNISTIPIFQEDIANLISDLAIINTSLAHLPQVKDWPRLTSLRSIGNTHIPCQSVVNFQEANPNINLLSDCYSERELMENATFVFGGEAHHKNTDLLGLLILPLLASIIAFIRTKWLKLNNIWNDSISIRPRRHPTPV